MTGQDESRWRTVRETAAHFKVGKNAVYENCKAGAWPHHRTGMHATAAIRFSAEDWQCIDELMRPAHVATAVVPQVTPRSRMERGMKRRFQSEPSARNAA